MLKSKIRISPNVRDVRQPFEINALKKRYHNVKELTRCNSSDNTWFHFECATRKTSATINLSLIALWNLIKKENSVYENYYQKLEFSDENRNEKRIARVVVDTVLFDQYGQNIRYAALSLKGTGLTAYGECCIYLKTEYIRKRASLLEENSFKFFNNYPISPLKEPKIPYGYRSDWKNRHKLAVAKLWDKIEPDMQEDDFADILLKNEKDKEKDDFIEVHIFDEFKADAIEKVVGIDPDAELDEDDILYLAMVKKKLGERWEQV